MKVSDYIVQFLIEREITDVFGYPGGMVTHLMDSFSKKKDLITAHVSYHEQGAGFAACGYAQTSLNAGVSYATSGPGATNLVTSIANAYYDSIPVLFITGQVNTYEGKCGLPLRQKGFQEMDVISMVSGVTKFATMINDAQDIRYYLEKSYALAMNGRRGPVLLDIPMDIQRADINPSTLKSYEATSLDSKLDPVFVKNKIYDALTKAKRPCILVGAGVNSVGTGAEFIEWVNNVKIPVVSSMPAIDAMPNSPLYYGFIGAYGQRHANFILAKSDLIITLGTRLDLRQTGANTKNFAVNAHLFRIDVDETEFSHKVKENEEGYVIDLKDLMPVLATDNTPFNFCPWIDVCTEIKERLQYKDEQNANMIIRTISEWIPKNAVVTTDVGQNQVWVAQSFIPRGQRILFSSGHGAMGYSLPAAIGAYYGSCGKTVICFTGDGGLQMNIQELQFIVREKLPIKIILLNNHSLGMIRHFQEMYFESNYTQTKAETGYTNPNFINLAKAYGISHCKVESLEQLDEIKSYLNSETSAFIEISLEEDTYVFPKLAMGKLNQDQDPELERDEYDYISHL